MQHEIVKYPVQQPVLRDYIRFFWEFRVDHLQLNHKLIPQRNINFRFNLSETPHILSLDGKEHRLETTYFSGLHDHYTNAQLKLCGRVHTLGICFYPEGLYPFLKIPIAEFKNQLLGAVEIGFKKAASINEQLKDAPDIAARLNILENELIMLLIRNNDSPEKFRAIFNALKNSEQAWQITGFCKQNNIGVRTLERMYNKYVGVSASTYGTLNRFHASLNRILYKDFTKLSDLAYDNGYFDQMHFIRDFKRFAGNTPKSFVSQNDSILQVGKLT